MAANIQIDAIKKQNEINCSNAQRKPYIRSGNRLERQKESSTEVHRIRMEFANFLRPQFYNIQTMKRVILESPYAGDIQRNIKYARECLKDSIKRGEAPIASHLLYTQVLDDNIPEERQHGIDAGLAWKKSG